MIIAHKNFEFFYYYTTQFQQNWKLFSARWLKKIKKVIVTSNFFSITIQTFFLLISDCFLRIAIYNLQFRVKKSIVR